MRMVAGLLMVACTTPVALIEVAEEPAGDNCVTGGQRVSTGLDEDGDGALAASEYDNTSYVCNGTAGVDGQNGNDGENGDDGDDGDDGLDGVDGEGSLVDIERVPVGEACAFGGILIRAGVDSDADGVLAENEVSDEVLSCDGNPFRDAYAQVDGFTNNSGLDNRPGGLAWDGTHFWATGVGTSSGDVVAQWDADYGFVGFHQSGIDFRSVFTAADGVGPVFGRQFNTNNILEMTKVGVFGLSVALKGVAIDSQASVVWDDVRERYVSQVNGTVRRWDSNGAEDTEVTLLGFGDIASETSYPQNRGIVVMGEYYVTYTDQTASVWNPVTGERLSTVELTGAGNSNDSYWSLGYADGLLWVVDANAGDWRGYAVAPR